MKPDRELVTVQEGETTLSGEIFFNSVITALVGVKTKDLEQLECWGHCFSLGWRTASMIRAELIKPLSTEPSKKYIEDFFEKELAPHTDTKLFKWYLLDQINVISSLELILKDLEEDVKG